MEKRRRLGKLLHNLSRGVLNIEQMAIAAAAAIILATQRSNPLINSGKIDTIRMLNKLLQYPSHLALNARNWLNFSFSPLSTTLGTGSRSRHHPACFKNKNQNPVVNSHQLCAAIPLSPLTATAADDAETTALAAAALLFCPLSFFDLLPLLSFFPVRVSGSSLCVQQSQSA